MKNYLAILILFAIALSCKKDELKTSQQPYIWTPKLEIQKGNGEATLVLIDLRPLTEYYPFPPSNPDFFKVYYSTDNKSFSFFKEVDVTTQKVTIGNLENGKTYYFTVAAIKDDLDPLFSDTVMTIPSKIDTPEELFTDLDFSLERITLSYDRKYLTFSSDDHPKYFGIDMLYYKSVSTDSAITIGQRAYQANWSPVKNMFSYISSKTVQNTIYPVTLNLFDVETKTTSTLMDIDYEKYYIWAHIFSPDGKKIAFLSSENSSNKNSYNLWTIELSSKLKTKIADLESLGFVTDGGLSWASNGDEIYIDGYYKSEASEHSIYKLKISTGELTPVLESDWSDFRPTISPDNSKLAFISNRSGNSELWMYNLSTQKINQITGEGTYNFDSRYTNIQWLNNNEVLISVFKNENTKAVKLKME